MEKARLVRRIWFTASHRYGTPGSPTEEDRERFGAQAEPHEHRWSVEVHVVGPMDPETGWVVDLEVLDGALAELTEGWDGGDLNVLVPEVAEGAFQPSTENLARWLYRTLAPRVPAPAELDQVRIFEDPELGSAYPAHPAPGG